MKTSGKLEIESKGKRVHKNADKSNPAVHVERDGNDVVKRASELKRLRGGGDEETAAQGGQGGDVTAEESGATTGPSQEAQPAQETGEKQTTEGEKKKLGRGAKRSKKATKAGAKKKAGGRGQKKTTEEAAVGEKREREEGGAKEGEDIDMEKGKKEVVTTSVRGEADRDAAGKETKRAKIAHKGEHGKEPTGPEPEETAAGEHQLVTEHGSEAAAAETNRTEAVEG